MGGVKISHTCEEVQMERIVVGMSGASGAILGIRLLEVLGQSDYEVHLVMSESTEKTIKLETDWKVEDVLALADVAHDFHDIGASIASGSFRTRGMVIVPCSMKTMSALANSFNTNLLIRAADVTLKERRRLVVVPRESPLHAGHLDLMAKVERLRGMILPPFMTFYHRPKTLDDVINHLVGKVLDCFHIENHLFDHWGEIAPQKT
jgi:4-hydroxy-3-polyprenylbenzoate decarboxylase